MRQAAARTGGAIARTSEAGVAMLWAILVILAIAATTTLVVVTTMVNVDETRDDANRTRSSIWVEAASNDLLLRIRGREVGYDIAQVGSGTNGPGADDLLTVPTTGLATPNPSYPVTGSGSAARLLTFTQAGTTYRAWYQVLPPTGTATGWRARFVRDSSRMDAQGEIEFVIRVWEDGRNPEPVIGKLSFRQTSISKFSLLSDDFLQLGGLGNLQPQGYVHTNNARGVSPAIEVNGSAGSATKITSSEGAITGCGQPTCVAGVGDVVEFGAAGLAIKRVEQLSTRSTPIPYASTGVASVVSPTNPGTAPTNMPAWTVDLDPAPASGCGTTGILVSSAQYQLRKDLTGVPLLDDRFGPIGGTAPGFAPRCIPVAEGGGAVVLYGDVFVSGMRKTNRSPVTIMARRGPFPPVSMDSDSDGIFETINVTAPASIYLVRNAGPGVGSNSSQAPVGLVAEGGVYLPSYEMNGIGNVMRVDNVAAMAASGEVAMGPSILAIAADGSQPGMGLSPADARALGYGNAQRLIWNGAIASSRSIYFRYGTSNAGNGYLGFKDRDINYVDDLAWNPPAMYPTNHDWYEADFEEFG